jgi:hypothetical protein
MAKKQIAGKMETLTIKIPAELKRRLKAASRHQMTPFVLGALERAIEQAEQRARGEMVKPLVPYEVFEELCKNAMQGGGGYQSAGAYLAAEARSILESRGKPAEEVRAALTTLRAACRPLAGVRELTRLKALPEAKRLLAALEFHFEEFLWRVPTRRRPSLLQGFLTAVEEGSAKL